MIENSQLFGGLQYALETENDKFLKPGRFPKRSGCSIFRSKNYSCQVMLDFTNRPLAASGFISYRCKNGYGWTMIGAKDNADALNEARRTDASAQSEWLQIWNNDKYVPITATMGELF